MRVGGGGGGGGGGGVEAILCFSGTNGLQAMSQL